MTLSSSHDSVTVSIVGFLLSPLAMHPISLLSIMTLYLATVSASIMSEQQPMREDAPIRTTTSWEYHDCGS